MLSGSRTKAAFCACLAAAWLVPAQAATPARAKPVAAVVQDYTPSPAIWLLEDPDTRIYMLGTIHALPPGFRWRSPAIEAAVKASEELIVETYDAPDEDLSPEMTRLFTLDKPVPLLERVPAQHRDAVRKQVAKGPIPMMFFARLKTWMAAVALGYSEMMGRWGVDDPDQAPGVEDSLEESFRAAGKPIGSIEDPIDVVRSIDAIPESVQRELLVAGLTELEQADEASFDEDDHAWAQGRVEDMSVDDDLPPAFFEALVVRRNAAWTEWLAKRLERPGTVLLAVGAGHLAGKASVQTMLEKRGLAVKRVD